jgi:hypothetical protein
MVFYSRISEIMWYPYMAKSPPPEDHRALRQRLQRPERLPPRAAAIVIVVLVLLCWALLISLWMAIVAAV